MDKVFSDFICNMVRYILLKPGDLLGSNAATADSNVVGFIILAIRLKVGMLSISHLNFHCFLAWQDFFKQFL